MAAKSARSNHGDAGVPVGVALARLRRRVGITGQELGRRAGMSQAKVSKIETGAVHPTSEDVELLARHLGASPTEIDRLAHQAEASRDAMMDWRAAHDDPLTWQREIAQLEAAAHELRVFQPAVISGLLQTSEYARSILATMRAAWTDPAAKSTPGIAETVSARVQRQQILDDPTKRFHFVFPETLLHNLLASAEDMPGQLRRLSEVAQQANVSLSIVPETERWPYPPFHNFSLLDDKHVIIDLYNTTVITRGHSDLRLYRQVFDAMESRATRDVEPILEKYRHYYLRLAAQQP
jgi:transcriptional regulator with XRE-family HTH domain